MNIETLNDSINTFLAELADITQHQDVMNEIDALPEAIQAAIILGSSAVAVSVLHSVIAAATQSDKPETQAYQI